MADVVDLKGVLKHLVNGTLEPNLCRICLLPLGEVFEHIFTKVCKEDQEYCIADVLEAVCQIKISPEDNYNVCPDCFMMASSAYRFHTLSNRSEEILNFYIEELENKVYSFETVNDFSKPLCITLPEYKPSIENFDYDIEPCLTDNFIMENESYEDSEQEIITQPKRKSKHIKEEEMDVVVVINENGQKSFFNMTEKGMFEVVPNKIVKRPARKPRNPMEYVYCSQCPVKYRFLSKLKKHMKEEHGIDIFICKVCKQIIGDANEFEMHVSSHTGIHCCDYCSTVFKKRDTIIAHLKCHEEKKNIDMDSAHVCEICGYISQDEDELKDHCEKKHDKKFTCFYCGKMYKSELSCDTHIRKHETHMISEKEGSQKAGSVKTVAAEAKPEPKTSSRIVCDTCGKDFVDGRSLQWHTMLHTNERPYTCDICGRGFISLNRRNQHKLCAHSQPTKQCPLCPALFHLRSMVNSHIKKVHLMAHKRRHRSTKHSNMHVSWRTEPVPLQDLSIAIQSGVLDLKTRQASEQAWTGSE